MSQVIFKPIFSITGYFNSRSEARHLREVICNSHPLSETVKNQVSPEAFIQSLNNLNSKELDELREVLDTAEADDVKAHRNPDALNALKQQSPEDREKADPVQIILHRLGTNPAYSKTILSLSISIDQKIAAMKIENPTANDLLYLRACKILLSTNQSSKNYGKARSALPKDENDLGSASDAVKPIIRQAIATQKIYEEMLPFLLSENPNLAKEIAGCSSVDKLDAAQILHSLNTSLQKDDLGLDSKTLASCLSVLSNGGHAIIAWVKTFQDNVNNQQTLETVEQTLESAIKEINKSGPSNPNTFQTRATIHDSNVITDGNKKKTFISLLFHIVDARKATLKTLDQTIPTIPDDSNEIVTLTSTYMNNALSSSDQEKLKTILDSTGVEFLKSYQSFLQKVAEIKPLSGKLVTKKKVAEIEPLSDNLVQLASQYDQLEHNYEILHAAKEDICSNKSLSETDKAWVDSLAGEICFRYAGGYTMKTAEKALIHMIKQAYGEEPLPDEVSKAMQSANNSLDLRKKTSDFTTKIHSTFHTTTLKDRHIKIEISETSGKSSTFELELPEIIQTKEQLAYFFIKSSNLQSHPEDLANTIFEQYLVRKDLGDINISDKEKRMLQEEFFTPLNKESSIWNKRVAARSQHKLEELHGKKEPAGPQKQPTAFSRLRRDGKHYNLRLRFNEDNQTNTFIPDQKGDALNEINALSPIDSKEFKNLINIILSDKPETQKLGLLQKETANKEISSSLEKSPRFFTKINVIENNLGKHADYCRSICSIPSIAPESKIEALAITGLDTLSAIDSKHLFDYLSAVKIALTSDSSRKDISKATKKLAEALKTLSAIGFSNSSADLSILQKLSPLIRLSKDAIEARVLLSSFPSNANKDSSKMLQAATTYKTLERLVSITPLSKEKELQGFGKFISFKNIDPKQKEILINVLADSLSSPDPNEPSLAKSLQSLLAASEQIDISNNEAELCEADFDNLYALSCQVMKLLEPLKPGVKAVIGGAIKKIETLCLSYFTSTDLTKELMNNRLSTTDAKRLDETLTNADASFRKAYFSLLKELVAVKEKLTDNTTADKIKEGFNALEEKRIELQVTAASNPTDDKVWVAERLAQELIHRHAALTQAFDNAVSRLVRDESPTAGRRILLSQSTSGLTDGMFDQIIPTELSEGCVKIRVGEVATGEYVTCKLDLPEWVKDPETLNFFCKQLSTNSEIAMPSTLASRQNVLQDIKDWGNKATVAFYEATQQVQYPSPAKPAETLNELLGQIQPGRLYLADGRLSLTPAVPDKKSGLPRITIDHEQLLRLKEKLSDSESSDYGFWELDNNGKNVSKRLNITLENYEEYNFPLLKLTATDEENTIIHTDHYLIDPKANQTKQAMIDGIFLESFLLSTQSALLSQPKQDRLEIIKNNSEKHANYCNLIIAIPGTVITPERKMEALAVTGLDTLSEQDSNYLFKCLEAVKTALSAESTEKPLTKAKATLTDAMRSINNQNVTSNSVSVLQKLYFLIELGKDAIEARDVLYNINKSDLSLPSELTAATTYTTLKRFFNLLNHSKDGFNNLTSQHKQEVIDMLAKPDSTAIQSFLAAYEQARRFASAGGKLTDDEISNLAEVRDNAFNLMSTVYDREIRTTIQNALNTLANDLAKYIDLPPPLPPKEKSR